MKEKMSDELNVISNHTMNTPLMQACQCSNLDLVKKLLNEGVNVHAVNSNGDTALTLAFRYTADVEVIKTLIYRRASIRHVTYTGDTSLTLACTYIPDPDLIQELLLTGQSSVHTVTNTGDTCLTLACRYGAHVDVVKILIDAGADVHVVNNAGDTPLMLACHYIDNVEVVQKLIDSGADAHAPNNNSSLILSYPAMNLKTKKNITEISNTLWIQHYGDWKILFRKDKNIPVTREYGISLWSWKNNEEDTENHNKMDLSCIELDDVIFSKLTRLIPPRTTKKMKSLLLYANYLQNPWNSLAQLDLRSLVYLDLGYHNKQNIKNSINSIDPINPSIDYEIQNIQKIYPGNLLNLVTLDISHCNLSLQHIQSLTRIDLPKLEKINLSGNFIATESLKVIGQIALVSPIKHLSLNSCGLNDESLEILSNTNIQLLSLYLNNNYFTQLGMYYLIKMDTTQLNDLSLNRCQLDNLAIQELSKLQADNLKILNLSNNNFTWGVDDFARKIYAPQLKYLNIFDRYEIDQKLLQRIRKEMNIMEFVTKMSVSIYNNISSNILIYTTLRNNDTNEE